MRSRLCAAVLLFGLGACLPDDESTPKGAILVTVAEEEIHVSPSFLTDDGWTITFDKAILVAHLFVQAYPINPDLPASCKPAAIYQAANVERATLIDLRQPFVFQDSGVDPANVQCYAGIDVNGEGLTDDDVRVAPGVEETELSYLRSHPIPDVPGVFSGLSPPANMHLGGTATRGEITKQFDVLLDPSAHLVTTSLVEIPANDRVEFGVSVSLRQLFLSSSNGAVRFDAWAYADQNNDGTITESELNALKLRDIPASDGYYWEFSGPAYPVLLTYLRNQSSKIFSFVRKH